MSPINENGTVDISIQTNPNDLINITNTIDAINRISISNTIDTNDTSQNNMYYTLHSDSDTDSAVNELPQITIDSYLLLADIEEYINHYNYSDTDSET